MRIRLPAECRLRPAASTATAGAMSCRPPVPRRGAAPGKQMHKPVTFPTPRDKGSLTIRGKFPGCVVGARYPVMKLGNAAKRYTLQDAIITSCGTVSSGGDALPMEEVSFNYAKIKT